MKKFLAVLVLMAMVVGAVVPILVQADTASACEYYEGRTPGYWKNKGADSWASPYTHNMDFDEAFGLAGNPTGDLTLMEALTTGGGKQIAFNRHAVAALLNASSPDVDYYWGVGTVKNIVHWAYDGINSWNYYKDKLEEQNEMGVHDD